MTNHSEYVRKLVNSAYNSGKPGFEPAILMDKDIDHDKVVEYTSTYVNDSWAPKIKELITDGWVIFRIQTELNLNGHDTMAYFAKLKS